MTHRRWDILALLVFAATCLLFASGCRDFGPENLLDYFDRNLTIEKAVGGFIVELGFRNGDYLQAKRMSAPDAPGSSGMRSEPGIPEYNYMVITFSIDPSTGVNPMSDPINSYLAKGRSEYSRAVEELRNGKIRSAKLVLATGDSLAPISYYLDRSLGKSPFTRFTYIFPRSRDGKVIDLSNSRAVVRNLAWLNGEMEMHIPFVPRLRTK
jgi:hypothetical protein